MAISVDSDGELTPVDALLDDNIITNDLLLCYDEFFSGVDSGCSKWTTSSVRFHDHWIAEERWLELFDRVTTRHIVWPRYLDSDLCNEEVGSVLVYAKRMYHKRWICERTSECLKECCHLSIFTIHSMKHRDYKIVCFIFVKKYI